MLDWDDVRSFLAVARHGNLSAAARALRVTQTTMGRRLDTMQQRVGARLLQRTPRGFVLTPAGEGAMDAALRMEAEALSFERAVAGQDARLEGLVRISTVEALGTRVLTPSLAGLRARNPGIVIQFDTTPRSVSLARREADIAVRLAEFAEPDVTMRRAAEMAFGVYAAPGYLAARGMPDFTASAAGHTTIQFEEALQSMPEMRWFAQVTSRATVAFRSNSRDAQMQAALGGMGLACLPRYMAAAEEGLRRLPTPEAPPRRGIWIGVHGDVRQTPRIRAVVEALGEGLRRAAPQLQPQD